jgi:hypothetical protein
MPSCSVGEDTNAEIAARWPTPYKERSCYSEHATACTEPCSSVRVCRLTFTASSSREGVRSKRRHTSGVAQEHP